MRSTTCHHLLSSSHSHSVSEPELVCANTAHHNTVASTWGDEHDWVMGRWSPSSPPPWLAFSFWQNSCDYVLQWWTGVDADTFVSQKGGWTAHLSPVWHQWTFLHLRHTHHSWQQLTSCKLSKCFQTIVDTSSDGFVFLRSNDCLFEPFQQSLITCVQQITTVFSLWYRKKKQLCRLFLNQHTNVHFSFNVAGISIYAETLWCTSSTTSWVSAVLPLFSPSWRHQHHLPNILDLLLCLKR